MGMVIAIIAFLFVFAAFIVIGALFGFLAGGKLVALTITLLILGASILIASALAVIFRIREGAYGR